MDKIRNGMPAVELPSVAWRKSSRSGALGNCVELSWFAGRAGVRNSRDPNGPVLVLPESDVRSFVASVKEA